MHFVPVGHELVIAFPCTYPRRGAWRSQFLRRNWALLPRRTRRLRMPPPDYVPSATAEMTDQTLQFLHRNRVPMPHIHMKTRAL